LPRIEKIIGKIPEKEAQQYLILGLQDIEDGIENFNPKRDHETEASHGCATYHEHVGQKTITWYSTYDASDQAHDKKGAYGIDDEDHGQVLYPKPLKKGCFGKIVKDDIGGTDEKQKERRPKK
jgi:hypothetical protein